MVFLAKVPQLEQLTDEQRAALGSVLVQKKFQKGERIIEQGTSGSEFFFVEQGKAEAYQRTKKGDKEVKNLVNTFEAGDYFGEGALIRDAPRNADVVAVSETVDVLILHRAEFNELLGGLEHILEQNFKARTLKGVDLLSTLTDAERALIADELKPITFEANSKIVTQGDQGDCLYIIRDGEVAFSRVEDDGVENDIGNLFKGQVFGEGALLTNEPRRATGKAVGEVKVFYLHRDVFSKVFAQSLQDMLNRDFAKRKDLTDASDGSKLLEFVDLQTINVLGAGTYGQVLLVSHKVTGMTYALKSMNKSKIKEMSQEEHVENERMILSTIHHPFLINLVQTFTSKDHVFALMEVVLGGELFAYMRNVGKVKAKDMIFYIAQVVLAFEYLHSLNIVYRDLKPENILITNKGYIKLTDFGLAKILTKSSGGRTYTLCGTPTYAAPEVYNMGGHGKAVDWWGMGVLIHEMITGTTPFDGDATAIFAAMERYSRAYPNIRLPRGLDKTVAGDMVLKLVRVVFVLK